jgi:hypothetical protein
VRLPIFLGLLISLASFACGRSDQVGFDAGVVAREPVEGCTWIGAYDRVVLRSATRAPAGCVVVQLAAKNGPVPAGLQLPSGWVLEVATWRPTSCDVGWLLLEGAVVTASTVSGRVTLLPRDPSSSYLTSSDVELLMKFDSESAPAIVELGGVGTPLTKTGC